MPRRDQHGHHARLDRQSAQAVLARWRDEQADVNAVEERAARLRECHRLPLQGHLRLFKAEDMEQHPPASNRQRVERNAEYSHGSDYSTGSLPQTP
jgi:hypothetical protein